jgi:glycosyltransferase involved in cell wall biosynthesis
VIPATEVTLSVVMPAYNEESAIEAAVAEVREWILDRVPGAEFVVVDDGSRDLTGAMLDSMARDDSRIRVIHLPNGGHGPALLTGIEATRGARLFLLDSDRQIPLSAFPPLWDAVDAGKDGAFGVRAQREDPPFRLWLTRHIRWVLTVLFGVHLTDANVPFKLLRRPVWDAAGGFIPADTLAPSLFLAVFVAVRHYDITAIVVPHRERTTGVVSIRRWRLVTFCWRAFGQLLAFRRRLRA